MELIFSTPSFTDAIRDVLSVIEIISVTSEGVIGFVAVDLATFTAYRPSEATVYEKSAVFHPLEYVPPAVFAPVIITLFPEAMLLIAKTSPARKCQTFFDVHLVVITETSMMLLSEYLAPCT